MYYRIRELYTEGYSQRAIARKLGIDRREVAKLLKQNTMDKDNCLFCQTQVAGKFDVAKNYIDNMICNNPFATKRELYQQVLKKYPLITLSERSFRRYLDKLGFSRISSQTNNNQVRPASSQSTIKIRISKENKSKQSRYLSSNIAQNITSVSSNTRIDEETICGTDWCDSFNDNVL